MDLSQSNDQISIAQMVAGAVLIIYLLASVFGMTPPTNQLIQAIILGAVILLFGDAWRRLRAGG